MKTATRTKRNSWADRKRRERAQQRLDLEAWYRSEQDADIYRTAASEG